jgi:hypothetical protein
MIIFLGECGRNARGTDTARVFSERFPNRNAPDNKVILRTIQRTQETGNVMPDADRKEIGGAPRIPRTVENACCTTDGEAAVCVYHVCTHREYGFNLGQACTFLTAHFSLCVCGRL